MTTRGDFPYPQREGYTFQGWYDNADGGNRITSYTFTENKTIYAHWKINQYTVTFNANGGTIDGKNQIQKTYNYGTTIYIRKNDPVNDPVKENWKFLGWYDNPSVGNNVTQFVLKSDTTLYAHWEHEQINIIFDSNTSDSVSNMPQNQTIYKGESLNVGTPSRKNYAFKGWSTERNGSVVYKAGTSYTFKQSQTLFAVWKLTSADYSGSSSTPDALSSDWRTCGNEIWFGEGRKITRIYGSIGMGANDMWSDRFFSLAMDGYNGSDWVTIWGPANSDKFKWNFGKDRSYWQNVDIWPNTTYYAIRVRYRYSTSIDSGGAKWAKFNLTVNFE